jgi:hypothetical protein
MSDRLLALLIPAIAVIVSALIAAFAQVGRGRDTAVLLALSNREAEIRRLEGQIHDLEEDRPHHDHNHPNHPPHFG